MSNPQVERMVQLEAELAPFRDEEASRQRVLARAERMAVTEDQLRTQLIEAMKTEATFHPDLMERMEKDESGDLGLIADQILGP